MSTAKTPEPDKGAEFDEVEAKIDKCLDEIHKKVEADGKGVGRADSPTRGFRPDLVKKTQQAFQAMSEDSILTDSHEDVRLKEPAPKSRPILRFKRK